MKQRLPFVIGLTGSIGMGKSTTAKMFADLGIAVWDADQAVARLYAKGGAAVRPIEALCANAVVDGTVDRAELRDWIASDATALSRIEAVVHPMVAQDRAAFLRDTDSDIVVLDIPLLFETGSGKTVDIVVVASVTAHVQRARVMQRGDMTGDQFDLLLAKQMPDAEKRARADVVILTETLESARSAVQNLVADIREKVANA